jgi:hypothetical protein
MYRFVPVTSMDIPVVAEVDAALPATASGAAARALPGTFSQEGTQ